MDELHVSVEMLYDGNPPQSLGDIPLTVISASCSDVKLSEFEKKIEADPNAKNEGVPIKPFLEAVQKWQANIAGLSSKGREIQTKLSHPVHFDDPPLVLTAIREYLPEAAAPQDKMTG